MHLGFLGAGRMATALARGCANAGLVSPGSVLASDPSDAARANFEQAVPGAKATADNLAVLALQRQQTLGQDHSGAQPARPQADPRRR